MAKAVNFPLKISGAEVRTIEQLREHFNLAEVLEYYANGKLQKWLASYCDDTVTEKVGALDKSAPDFKKQLCEILGADYSESEAESADLESISEKNKRRDRLRAYTADDVILNAAERVAFTQEELVVLVEKGADTVYLCGESFVISRSGIKYIGVNKPRIEFEEDFSGEGAEFENVDSSVIDKQLAEETEKKRKAEEKKRKAAEEKKRKEEEKRNAAAKDPYRELREKAERGDVESQVIA